MDSIAKHAARQLVEDMESRKSVEVRSELTIHNHTARAGGMTFNLVADHYIETATGRRLLESENMKDGKVVSRSFHYGDGTKFADVNFNRENPDEQAVVYIKREFWLEEKNDRKQLPASLLYLYVGREPLYEALTKAEYLGKSEVIGRECHAFLFPQVRWGVVQDQVFHLDNATSIPLKVESYRDKEARDKKESMGVWTAQSLDKVEGHYVPLKSTMVAYNKDGSPMFTWEYNVKSIEFNKTYPASKFWPKLEPGVQVLDALTKKSYEVPGAKRELAKPKQEAATSAPPIQAVPPTGWSTPASGVSLALGCAVLLSAGVLWWQRRGSGV